MTTVDDTTPALHVQNVQLTAYSLSYDPPVIGATDNTGPIPRANTNIAYTEVLTRFPTFAMCLQAGFADILSSYDMVIVDPETVLPADVIAYKALGIKVFGAISLVPDANSAYANWYTNAAATSAWLAEIMSSSVPVVLDDYQMDGIFMDALDDADALSGGPAALASLVNQLKAQTNTLLIANQGFSNLGAFIQSCAGVMFQSWLTSYNATYQRYLQTTDSASIDLANSRIVLLASLRTRHVFDVFSWNFVEADGTDDNLRQYCTEEDHKRGYLSWTSPAALVGAIPNTDFSTPDQPITTAVMKRQRIKTY